MSRIAAQVLTEYIEKVKNGESVGSWDSRLADLQADMDQLTNANLQTIIGGLYMSIKNDTTKERLEKEVKKLI